MKTAVSKCPTGGLQVEQSGLCSTCVPPAASKKRRCGTPASPCPVSKIGTCSTGAIKKQHTPRICAPQPRFGPVWAFPGRGGNVPRPDCGGDVGTRCGKEKTDRPRHSERSEESVFSASSRSRHNMGLDPSTPLRSAQDDSKERWDRISPGQKLQNAAQRSGCVLERRSHGAQSKKRQLPQAPGVSEPCGVCFDDAGASRAAGCPPPAARHRAEARTHFS